MSYPTPPSVYDWIDRKKAQLLRAKLEFRLQVGRRRGFKAAMVNLDDLEQLLSLLPTDPKSKETP